MKYEELARNAEGVEFNTKENTTWKNIKKDGNKMWDVFFYYKYMHFCPGTMTSHAELIQIYSVD